MSRSFSENLQLYAQLAVRAGVNIQPGQELLINADIADAPLVRLLVEEAYRVGAKHVAVMYSDEATTLIRFAEGSDQAMEYYPTWMSDGITRAMSENAARLVVTGGDPRLLGSVDPARVATASKAAATATRPMQEYIGGFRINWCIVGAAGPSWAKQVFPHLATDEAVRQLWEAIFLTARVLEPDPKQAWEAHCASLEARRAWLNDLRLDRLEFRGPGTDLQVGLVANHVWLGGRSTARNGVTCAPNVPTEEVFTMPDRTRTNGVVSSTKPLSARGQLIDGIQVEFRDGEAISVRAEKGEATLQAMVATDPGAARLGEVALVPNSSGVSRAGVLFLNTLYDENAASHIAFGRALADNMAGYNELDADAQLAAGANDSMIHVDWMIGSGEVDVTGIRPDGSPVPLMRAGEWVE